SVSLITEVAIEESLRFAVREGGRTIAAGIITKLTI
ncbi:MAG: EF-Tu/IF-2/RF-3 family GTPase, partial [Candidatus Hodgkinia cicadicola]